MRSMLTIEANPPKRSRCECCGGTTTTLVRFVYENRNPRAIYYARFSDDHPNRGVDFLVSIGEYGEGTTPDDRIAFAMELRTAGVCVRDARASPWSDAKIVGRILDRVEGLAHPLVAEAFHIVDHATLEDAPLREYLERAATFRAS